MRAGVLALLAVLALGAAAPTGQQPPSPAPSPGQAAVSQEPEYVSPSGRRFFAKPDADGAIAKADAALAAVPADLNLLLGAARARDNALQFSGSIPLYTRAIAADPSDVRAYRFRGHRYISTRRFPDAVRDLERARLLAPSSFDVAYHLALAYFLSGEFDRAAEEYGRCLAGREEGPLPDGWRSCAAVARSDDDRVAITDWRYRALRRAGRRTQAVQLLATIGEGMAVKENGAYYQALLAYRGLRTEDEVLAPRTLEDNTFVTTAYGLASYYVAEKRLPDACRLLRAIVADEPHWNAFGFIAAEADLATRLAASCRPS